MRRLECIFVVARMAPVDHALIQQRRDSLVVDPELRTVLATVGMELGLLLDMDGLGALHDEYGSAWSEFVLQASPLPDGFFASAEALRVQLDVRRKLLDIEEDRGCTSSESDYSDDHTEETDEETSEEDSEIDEESEEELPERPRQRRREGDM